MVVVADAETDPVGLAVRCGEREPERVVEGDGARLLVAEWVPDWEPVKETVGVCWAVPEGDWDMEGLEAGALRLQRMMCEMLDSKAWHVWLVACVTCVTRVTRAGCVACVTHVTYVTCVAWCGRCD